MVRERKKGEEGLKHYRLTAEYPEVMAAVNCSLAHDETRSALTRTEAARRRPAPRGGKTNARGN